MILLIIRAMAFTYLLIRTPILFMNGETFIAWVGVAGIFCFVWAIFKDLEK